MFDVEIVPACCLQAKYADGSSVCPHRDFSERPSLTRFLPGHSWAELAGHTKPQQLLTFELL